MTRNRRELDAALDTAAEEIRHDLPDDRAFTEAADRVWERLAAQMSGDAAVPNDAARSIDAIGGCADVRALLGPYLAGELPEGKALLIEDHTRGCLPCRRALMAAREGHAAPAATSSATPAVGWSTGDEETDTSARAGHRPRRWLLAAAAVLVVGLGVTILAATGLLGPIGPFGAGAGHGPAIASVESIDGSLYLVTGDSSRALRAGDHIARNQEVRTAKGSGAILRLVDGSRIELAERTEMAVRVGHLVNRGDTTLDLDQGRVIVEAAKRSRGHLFVDTEDCRVAVTGTIFAVNHGTKGSRVSVIEGEVRVEQGRREDLLHPGDQVTTRQSLAAVPVADEISWSRDLDKYLALLKELNALQEQIRQTVAAPQPRTATTLLDLAPAGTTLYAAVPNVAESMSEARRVLSERLASSPVLREALDERGMLAHQEEIDALIERIRDFGSYLGDEVAFAAVGNPGEETHDGSAVAYAQVLDPPAFRAFLEQEIERLAAEGHGDRIVLVDDPAHLPGGTTPGQDAQSALYVWPTNGFVVASIGPKGLPGMAATLAGEPGLRGSNFYDLLAGAYTEGVEWLVAADLRTLLDRAGLGDNGLGFEDAKYLMVRWSESGDHPSGRAVLAFDGPRHGVASWLAEPAPMGSLEYVTADAAAAAAFVVRDPEDLVDEMMAIMLRRDPDALARFEQMEQDQGFDLKHDLAAPLGGELAFALDGPLVPKPSFKVVIEVYDADRLQTTLEWAVDQLNTELAEHQEGTGHLSLTSEEIGGRTVWALSGSVEGAQGVAVYYTYVDSYLVAAPSPALLDTAIRAHQTGANLLASAKFRDLLPADGYANFSAVLYQDLGSRLGPLADMIAKTRDSGRELTADEQATLAEAGKLRPPSLGYAYGLEDRLVFAANFGGDGMMPLSALLGSAGGLAGFGGDHGLFGLLAPAAASDAILGHAQGTGAAVDHTDERGGS